MEKARKAVKGMFAAMTQRGERSTLFWWLVENHDEFAEAAKRQRIQWAVVVENASELGLTNRAGRPPTRKLAKLTWQRAKIYVARSRSVDGVAAPDQLRSVPMPRSSDARPVEAEPVEPVEPVAQSDWRHHDAGSLARPSAAAEPQQGEVEENFRMVVDAIATEEGPTQTGTELGPTRPTEIEPAWTPEQHAHLEAVLARVRERLDYNDRLLKLQE